MGNGKKWDGWKQGIKKIINMDVGKLCKQEKKLKIGGNRKCK